MASLKEIKTRIDSVHSTGKITSAMMMISSAKLNKAQATITNFLPYQSKLDEILIDILSSDRSFDTPYTTKREKKRCAIVAISSNTSLCGAFNSNIAKNFVGVYNAKKKSLGADNILVYTIGKKIHKAIAKMNIKMNGDYESLAGNPNFEEAKELAKILTSLFITKEVDEVILVYTHFISTGSQKITTNQFLPFVFDTKPEIETEENDYIFEPSKEEILNSLIPTVLYSRLYAAVLDSFASEQAGRMIAMQTASDNAKTITEELNIQYNKQRQQAVTNELLDIIGGANAINS